jgi:hypothetical protein
MVISGRQRPVCIAGIDQENRKVCGDTNLPGRVRYGPGAGARGAWRTIGAAPTFVPRLLWLPPLLLALWRFFPITRNYFFGDDLYNLYQIVNRNLVDYLLDPYGLHLLVTRNLIYYLCYRLFGTEVQFYFWLVLATHLVNVYLLFRVVEQFTGSARLACLAAALWGAAPINEGALGWYSVYGQVLAATVILWLLYELGRIADGERPARAAPLRWALLLLVASTSFGTGIGAAVAFPLVAALLLPPSPNRRRILLTFAVVAAGVLVIYYGVQSLAGADPARARNFRHAVLSLSNWPGVLRFTLHLYAYGFVNLVLAPAFHPAQYPSVWSHLLIGGALLGVAVALSAASARTRRQLLASLLLGAACYGIIAAGRITFFRKYQTQVISAPRYHYAATLPIATALFVLLGAARRRSPWQPRRGDAALAVALAVIGFSMIVRARPIDHHAGARQQAEAALASIRERIEAAPMGADVRIPNQLFRGVGPMILGRLDLFPGLAAVFAIYFPENVVAGRRVFFVEEDPKVLAAARQGRRTKTFVVGPEEPQAPVSHRSPPRERAVSEPTTGMGCQRPG